jgi:hypothetical protein
MSDVKFFQISQDGLDVVTVASYEPFQTNLRPLSGSWRGSSGPRRSGMKLDEQHISSESGGTLRRRVA